MVSGFQRILMVRLSALGDVVCTLPALRVLRKNFPKAYIAWAVEDGAKDVVKEHPDLDELIVVERKRWQKGILGPKTFLSTLREILIFFKELRRKKFDIVIDFHGIARSGIITLLSGGSYRVGFSRKFSKEFNYLFTNYRVSLDNERLRKIDRCLNLIRHLGVDLTDREPMISISNEDREYIDRYLSENISNRPIVLIHSGTSDYEAHKRWPLSGYVQLVNRLIEEHEVEVILTWGPEELEAVKEIASKVNHKVKIAPRTTIKQLTELIRRGDLFIGGDTGPMHIASAVKTPVVAILGPTDPAVVGPYGTRNQIVTKSLSCSPCRNRRCKSLECLRSITHSEVLEAAQRLLNSKN